MSSDLLLVRTAVWQDAFTNAPNQTAHWDYRRKNKPIIIPAAVKIGPMGQILVEVKPIEFSPSIGCRDKCGTDQEMCFV